MYPFLIYWKQDQYSSRDQQLLRSIEASGKLIQKILGSSLRSFWEALSEASGRLFQKLFLQKMPEEIVAAVFE